MTEPRPRRTRWSPGRIRAAAWLAGTATAIGSGAALAAAPMPPEAPRAAGRRASAPPRRVIERHVIRRIVIVEDAPAPVSAPTIVVQAPAAGAAAPAPAPTSTGGS